MLFACDMTTDSGDKDTDEGGQTEGEWVDGSIAYYHPDETGRTWVDAVFIDGKLDHLRNFKPETVTFKNKHLTFAGLFTEREGGVMVIDAEGNRVPGTEMTNHGVYYAQGKGEPISVKATITGTLSSPLPTTINYGDPFPETLPVPYLEGRRFLGWYEALEGYITGPDGVVLEQYRTLSSHHYIQVGLEWYTGAITSRYINIYPSYAATEESYYTVTYAFNDGTYRESVAEVLPGTAYADLEMPTGARELGEIVAWSIDPNSYVRPIGNVVENVTLYAVWKNYRYSCVVDGMGAERVEKVYEGESFSLGTPPPREGYTFLGWYDNELFLGFPFADTVTYGNAREYYYARWEAN